MNKYDFLYNFGKYGRYLNKYAVNFIYDYEIIIFDLSSIEANKIVLSLDNADRS